jgi:hypothetical protein
MHTLSVSYRPDNYPEWIPWREFEQKFNMIGTRGALDVGGVPTARPGFYPRLSFGKPQNACDNNTERNTRRGFEFQVRFQGNGHVVLDRFRIHAQKLIEKSRATC